MLFDEEKMEGDQHNNHHGGSRRYGDDDQNMLENQISPAGAKE